MSKPFHESIIDSIQEVTRLRDLRVLASLIAKTAVPKNHSDIMKAMMLKRDELLTLAAETVNVSFSEAFDNLREEQEKADGKSE